MILIDETINKIREFNYFYMLLMDLQGKHCLGSEYSAPEVKILYEIYKNSGCNAAYIAKVMDIDKSYLSRILKDQENKGYLYRKNSEKDSRAYELYLTEKGKNKTEKFMQESNQQIAELVRQLSKKDCKLLGDALDTIITILDKCKKNK